MSDSVIIFIAAIYAAIVAISSSKVGFIPALLFPITIVLLGTLQYVIFIIQPPPE